MLVILQKIKKKIERKKNGIWRITKLSMHDLVRYPKFDIVNPL